CFSERDEGRILRRSRQPRGRPVFFWHISKEGHSHLSGSWHRGRRRDASNVFVGGGRGPDAMQNWVFLVAIGGYLPEFGQQGSNTYPLTTMYCNPDSTFGCYFK